MPAACSNTQISLRRKILCTFTSHVRVRHERAIVVGSGRFQGICTLVLPSPNAFLLNPAMLQTQRLMVCARPTLDLKSVTRPSLASMLWFFPIRLLMPFRSRNPVKKVFENRGAAQAAEKSSRAEATKGAAPEAVWPAWSPFDSTRLGK